MEEIRVDVYSTMRNEVKIVPYFLRHYETFATRIFVWDDGSDDGTREILESHPKVKLLPISLGYPDDMYFVTTLWPQYKNISRGYSDWVICVDADEFVYHPDMNSKLQELKMDGARKVCCQGFEMYHKGFPTTKGQIYDEVKTGTRDDYCSTKVVLFDPTINIKWSVGRHKCSGRRSVTYNTGIILLHFRMLGYEYYYEKARRKFSEDRIKEIRMSRDKYEEYVNSLPYTEVVS